MRAQSPGPGKSAARTRGCLLREVPDLGPNRHTAQDGMPTPC
jgi:hypothetical protein